MMKPEAKLKKVRSMKAALDRLWNQAFELSKKDEDFRAALSGLEAAEAVLDGIEVAAIRESA